MSCKYWNEEHQDCSITNNTYEQGYNQALQDVYDRINEGVCDICEFHYEHCYMDCSSQEIDTIKKWLKEQIQ